VERFEKGTHIKAIRTPWFACKKERTMQGQQQNKRATLPIMK
jgi:hypothetical protein